MGVILSSGFQLHSSGLAREPCEVRNARYRIPSLGTEEEEEGLYEKVVLQSDSSPMLLYLRPMYSGVHAFQQSMQAATSQNMQASHNWLYMSVLQTGQLMLH